MSNTKQHTPGPWKFNSGATKTVRAKSGKVICTIWQQRTFEKNEAEANANLIQASPDLLAALERWQKEWTIGSSKAERANNYSIEQQIKEAISKAKGE